jgi:hypothetical protein
VIARRAALLAACLALAASAAGCGEDHPNVDLIVRAQWNTDPVSVDQIGYQILVELDWVDRAKGCSPLPSNLNLHVNDFQAVPMIDDGACATGAELAFGPFMSDVPVTVTLQEGDQSIGKAEFDQLFPGLGLGVVSPAGGQVNAGGPLVLSLPATPQNPTLVEARFYWLDTPASVPPFYSDVFGSLNNDGQTLPVNAPAQTGQAQVVIQGSFTFGAGRQVSCTGFQVCSSLTDPETAGPVSIEVVP